MMKMTQKPLAKVSAPVAPQEPAMGPQVPPMLMQRGGIQGSGMAASMPMQRPPAPGSGVMDMSRNSFGHAALGSFNPNNMAMTHTFARPGDSTGVPRGVDPRSGVAQRQMQGFNAVEAARMGSGMGGSLPFNTSDPKNAVLAAYNQPQPQKR